MRRPPSFLAQDDYLITRASHFSDFDQQVAISLYQPLIGPVALSLYLSLWPQAKSRPLLTERKKQTALMDLLNIDLDALFEARVRLEAVGLLRTFTAADQLGRYFVYELHAPVSPGRFFNDDLLGMLLYDQVGESRYQELADQFRLQPFRRPDWQEVTHPFLDVFQLNNVLAEPAVFEQAKQQTASQPAPTVSLGDASGYDWGLLVQMLKGSVDLKLVEKNQGPLFAVARLYGLNPRALAAIINSATDLITQRFSMADVRRIAEQQYRKANQRAVAPVQEPAVAPVADARFSSDEQAVLARAKQQSLRQFLDQTKLASGTQMQASNAEWQVVQAIVKEQVFSDAVINVLVDYVLRVLDQDTLNFKFVWAIATRWNKANVQTPEDALLAIHRYNDDKQKRQSASLSRNQRRPVRQEVRPEWMDQKQATATSNQPATEAQKRFQQLLKQRQAKGGVTDEANE